MAGRIGPSLRRRRVLQAAALTPLLAASPAALPAAADAAASLYLGTIAARLQLLRPDLLRLSARLRTALPAPTLAALTASVADTLSAAVGPVLASAVATVPGLIADDFSCGRVIEVEGIAFSHTEIALLSALG